MTREEFIANAVRELPNTYNNALPVKGMLMELAGHVNDCIKNRGVATVAEINALESPINGDTYRLSDDGNLNGVGDEVAVVTGDLATYNGETDLWELFVSGAAILTNL